MPQPNRAGVCPRCGQIVSMDQTRCPRCGLKRANAPQAASDGDRQIVRTVLWLNAGMFGISLLLGFGAIGLDPNPLSFLSIDDRSLLLLGATGTLPVEQLHRWWTLIAANYLHGSLLHLLFNMAAFHQLARLVVEIYGRHRATLIYALSGVVGFWVSCLFGVQLTIGASAAVCGLMGAVLYYGKSRGGPFGNLLYRQVGGWALFIFIFGVAVPGINNYGHGGGLAAGVVLGWLLGYRERSPESRSHRLSARFCIAATLLTLAWAVVSALGYLAAS